MATTETFDYTGSEQTWTVPDGVDEVQVKLYGAGTGNREGGLVEGTLATTPGETLAIYVGEGRSGGQSGGWPNGGPGGSSGTFPEATGEGGAGSTDIRQNGTALSDRVAVAGGAGGHAAVNNTNSTGDSDSEAGGSGGADTGGDGYDAYADGIDANGGAGGTQSAAGAGGTVSGATASQDSDQVAGGDGSGPAGGDGALAATAADSTVGAGGGGGGGYYGGGGGAAGAESPDSETDNVAAGGGAGGSNYEDGLQSVASNQRGAGNSGDGQIVITYEQQPDDLEATAVDGDQVDLSWTDTYDSEDGFNIYRAQQSGGDTTADYTQIDSVGANTTAYADTGLEDGERYFYRVTATDSDGFGESDPSNEAAATTTLPAPTLDSLDTSVEGEVSLTYTVTDDSTDGDVLIERSTDGGATWVGAATITDLSASSYTDTAVVDGETYTYRVTRRTDHTSAESGTFSGTTVAPAPVLDSLSVDGDVITVTFTDQGEGEDHFELEVSLDNGSSWSQSGGDVAALSGTGTQTSVDTAALLDGREYDVRVRAVYSDASPVSSSQQTQTALPDEDQPVLGNGVEDEIAVDREAQVHDNGSVRIQTRETGASAWDSSATGWDEQVLDHATLTTQVLDREDGEEYEVRARTETADATGAWTEPASIVTKFPGAANLTLVDVTQTRIDLEFDDNADNEDGFDVERREEFRDGFGEWRTVAELGANDATGSVTYTDGSVLPTTTYQYRIKAYTEHTSATSSSVQTTTDDDGVRADRVPAEGWHVVVERDDGVTVEPTIVGEPTINRKLNAKPTCEIPVAQHDRWSEEAWGGAEMRVYEDGQRQPIEELRRPRDEPGQVTLIGAGGIDLEERVTVDVIERDAHLVADDVVGDASSYARNVDDPAGDPSADVLQEAVDSQTEWLDAAGSDADQPWTIRNDGTLEALPTGGFFEAENEDEVTQYITEGQLTTSEDDRWSGGAIQRIEKFEQNNVRSGFAINFETHHDIPLADFGIAARIHYTGDTESDPSDAIHHSFTGTIDGTDIGTVGAAPNIGNNAQEWFLTVDGGLSGTLEAGTHTLEIRATEKADDGYDPASNWDCIAWFDDRFPPGFTETVSDDVITGPNEYPEVPVETGDVVSVRQIVGGRLDITSGRDAAQLELSNDNGVSWPISATDASTVEGQFSEGSDTLRARITLTGYDDSPNTSPAGRTAPQAVDGYELFADLDDTPLLVNRSYSGSAEEILQDIADYANALWEVTWDQAADAIAIEWTMPGQRTATVDLDLVDYSSETDYGSIHRRAVIKGNQVPASTDGLAAQHDSWVALDHEWLAEVGETVTDDSDTEYDRGVDYELKPNAGELQVLSTGSIADGESLTVEYDRHIVGEYESPDYDGTYPVLEETLPAVTTQRNAEQAALTAVRIASEPITTASVTVGELPSGVDLVDAINVGRLPGDDVLEQWAVDNAPRQTTVQLGSRDPVEETLDRLNSRLRSVSQKV